MNPILTQVRTDASPLSINLALTDLIWPVGKKLGWYGGKLIVAMISRWVANKWFPFRPEAVKLELADPPVLFDSASEARLTFHLTATNFAEWDFTSTIIDIELKLRSRPLFTLRLPLSLHVPQRAQISFMVQTHLTPGLVQLAEKVMGEATEMPLDLLVRLPAIHVLGQHQVAQQWNTTLRKVERRE